MATRQLLDTRNDAKLESFSGARDKFENWAFMLESYCHMLGWSDFTEPAITYDGDLENDMLGQQAKEVSVNLYYLLATKCKGPAASVIKLAGRGNGLVALRSLFKEYRTGLAI